MNENTETIPVISMMERMGLLEDSDEFLAPKGDKEDKKDYWNRRLDPNVETEKIVNTELVPPNLK